MAHGAEDGSHYSGWFAAIHGVAAGTILFHEVAVVVRRYRRRARASRGTSDWSAAM
jgi:hypothetical protein